MKSGDEKILRDLRGGKKKNHLQRGVRMFMEEAGS